MLARFSSPKVRCEAAAPRPPHWGLSTLALFDATQTRRGSPFKIIIENVQRTCVQLAATSAPILASCWASSERGSPTDSE